MAEAERHALAKREVGERFAELMIKAMPPEPERLATKDDLGVVRSDLRAEMADLRTELKTEMADLRTELKTEMAGLRTDMVEMWLSLTDEIHQEFHAQTRTLLIGLVASLFLIVVSNTLTVLAG